MSIGIEAKVANHNLSLVRNMGGYSCYELQTCLCDARRQVAPLLTSLAMTGWAETANFT